uniref:DUF2470 domain-containing protein n=1 Tax=Amphora coffeiformis TaxID=265554 RepID=A0A7S3LDU9_9STRA
MTDNKESKESSSSSDAVFEVSEETSSRVCKHMQDDHFISVYAMARNMLDLPGGWKLTDAKMKKVTSAGCHLQAVTCSGDLCEMKPVVYPFTPPLTNASQVKPRLVAIHHEVLSPQWKWVWTKPFAFKFMLTTLALAYGALVMGNEGLTEALDKTNLIKMFYPWTDTIAIVVQLVFYVTLVAHIMEASMVAHTYRTVFKLNWKGVARWIVMILVAGYPIMQEGMALKQIHEQRLKEASEKEAAKEEAKKYS